MAVVPLQLLGHGKRLHLGLPLPDDQQAEQHHQHDRDDEEVAPLLQRSLEQHSPVSVQRLLKKTPIYVPYS